tara:strand:+ start:145 stop:1200 length:1056 start_codon:yes stop_codon:yes gene_type:complete
MGGGINKGFGFNTGGTSGEHTVNTNVSNADLTSDGNHTLDVAATTLTIDSGAVDILKVNGATDKVIIGPSGADYTMPSDRPSNGEVLKASDGSGTLAWSADTNSNTNIANDDLTLDGNHSTNTNNQTLTIKNGTNTTALFNANGLTIGRTSPYIMPIARAGIAGKVLQSSDATTGTAWANAGFTKPFTMYMQGLTAANIWHYPEPMSNNKFLALARSSGVATPGAWNIINSTTIRSCTLGVNPFVTNIRGINFWASCLDNAGTITPTITVEVWEFPVAAGASTISLPTSRNTATTGATSDNNNQFQLGRSGGGGTNTSANTMLMPVFKVNWEDDEVDVDVWINATWNGYIV